MSSAARCEDCQHYSPQFIDPPRGRCYGVPPVANDRFPFPIVRADDRCPNFQAKET